MRPQYHLRDSPRGLLAWDVIRLIRLTASLPCIEVPLEEIRELDECHWYRPEGEAPTCRSVAEHVRLVVEADLGHPIILDPDGRVMDGMHRVCKALNQGLSFVKACRFVEMPEPDFIGVHPGDLPYKEA